MESNGFTEGSELVRWIGLPVKVREHIEHTKGGMNKWPKGIKVKGRGRVKGRASNWV